MKFVLLTQTLMLIGRLKPKPEVEFQYGGRSLFENASSYNSAAERDICTKFGTVTDSDLLRTFALSNWNRKLIRDVNGRHLENFNDIISMSPTVQFTKKSKPEVVFEYDFCLFLQNCIRFVQ